MDSYEIIYRKYARSLYLYGLQFISDKTIVEDCLHDVFIKLYEKKDKEEIRNIKQYLYIALKNTLLNVIKKQKQLSELSEDEHYLTEEVSPEDFMIEQESVNDDKSTANNMMRLLTLRQREVIYYRFYEGMSLNEIADLLQINYQSVQNIIQRSLNKLKDSYTNI
mgnify:CR=1 FL=1